MQVEEDGREGKVTDAAIRILFLLVGLMAVFLIALVILAKIVNRNEDAEVEDPCEDGELIDLHASIPRGKEDDGVPEWTRDDEEHKRHKAG
jgi:hypothetical protein